MPREELMSFLAVAGELKVKGLAENNSRPTKQESVFDALPPKPVAPCSPDEQPPSRKPLPTSVLQPKRQSLLLPQNDASKDFVSVKLEPYETPPLEQHQANHPTVQCFNEEDGAENEEKYEDDDQYEGDGFDAQLDRDKDGGKSLVLVLFIGTSICLLNFLQLKKIDTTGFYKIKCIMLTLGS